METSPPPPPPPPQPTPTIGLIFSETYRILKAQPRHFLLLSLFFLIPTSIAATVYPIFFKSLLTQTSFATQPPSIPTKTLLPFLAYLLFTFVFSISAVGSITNSVLKAFHGQPLKLESSIKSLSTSFFRLLGTNLLVYIITLIIIFVFTFAFVFLFVGATLLGFRINFYSPYFLLLVFAMTILLFFIIFFLHVNWSLSSVVVVVETTWGLASLKRSWSLVKGRRWLVVSLSLCLGTPLGVLSWINNKSLNEGVSSDELKWFIFPLAVQVLIFSALRTLIFLFAMASTTVMYVYFNKAFTVHGDVEFAGKYIRLAIYDDNDDEKAPAVVSNYV